MIRMIDFHPKELDQKLRHIDNQRFTLGKKKFNLEQKKLDNIENNYLKVMHFGTFMQPVFW